ncbi:metallophosphoesterase [Halomarina pelagica]|uniref:metallophosphoesterase n=1 Tax=Halomarina pelagica TaxID=2961599 RepID=UPI0020C3D700|nr:metallophosphoesterase [Halomarina sp. BND7]
MFEPVPGEPAAVATLDGDRALVVADYHAGLEVALRYDGVELRSRAAARREAVLDLLSRTDAERVVFLGDLGNAIGAPGREERRELERLLSAVAARVPVTVVRGNHDGGVEDAADAIDAAHPIETTPSRGARFGRVGFVHGHTWPGPDVLRADVVAMGHEHPMVRLEDEVGGSRAERAWLRGRLDPEPFEAFHGSVEIDGELVVCPAFNDLLGGTWTNAGQGFLAPFLPEGMDGAQAYLLDGTRLGEYTRV